MKTYNYASNIRLTDAEVRIAGHEDLLSIYILQAGKIALMDVGPTSSLTQLFKILQNLQINPEDISYILGTHIHLDHLGGLWKALQIMPNARCIVHEKGIRHLVNPERLWEGSLKASGQTAIEYGKPEPVNADRLIAASEGMIIDLDGVKLEIMLTPGHAPHHLSYLDRERRVLFPGEGAGIYFPDTEMVRPASPPPFDLRQSIQSVDKMIAVQPREAYYCHYGHSTKAVAMLELFRKQSLLWAEVIKQNLNSDVESIAEKILDLDRTREPLSHLTDDRLRSEMFFIHNNIRGYKEYFQKEGPNI